MSFTGFQRLVIAATALTYLLIAVGGLVRASGAGLGCPDWPRCFGSWVPPASAAELPPQFDPAQFNPALMWTEYLNRLLGVSVGFAILATAVSAWRRHRREPRILWSVVAAALLTGFQGWLGGRVVLHELAAWIVTVHMLVALIIVSLLLVALVDSLAGSRPNLAPGRARRALGSWTWAVIALLLGQVAVGTLVRGGIDAALERVARADALAAVGALDTVHRGLAAVVGLAVAGLWMWTWTRHGRERPLILAANAALAATVGQLIAGALLAGLAIPPAVQVAHLALASLMLGALTVLALVAWRWPESSPERTPARTHA
jgi:cytochrome c oxidase assembly protein subunit 15